MEKLRAFAICWHSDEFPGWVEVSVRDARGQDHRIVEKVPVITTLDIAADSTFPIEFWIEAEVASDDGDQMVLTLPGGIETTEGKRSLVVTSAGADRAC